MTDPYADDPYDETVLRTEVVRAGGRWSELSVVAETGSTHVDLAVRARGGAASGAVLVADFQAAGRGRRGRTWTAPPGSGIALSVLVRPPVPAQRWTWLPLVAGLAVADAVAAMAGVAVGLKWPNDILVGERKLGGILAERVESGSVPACVIGLGLNVALVEADLPVPTATSLAVERPGITHRRGPLVAAVLEALDLWLGRWEAGSAAVPTAYVERCATLGRRVEVRLPGAATVTGTAVGVDADGRLIVRTRAGLQTFGAGDVEHLRSPR